MKFLNDVKRFLFFTGKGGVGKTSLACATAIKLTENNKRVLLVSTDPASNVGQVFGVTIGNKITLIPEINGLSALEIDPQAAAQVYRDKIVGPVRGVLPDAIVKGIEEQLSGACTTEIAAFDEFTSLLTDDSLTKDFDHIVFDTAPTGHTIRLLQLPGAWTGFLEEGKGDASCLGPLAGLEKHKLQYKEAVDALSNPALSRLVLVARAQKSTLTEAERTYKELFEIGFKEQFLVINCGFPKSETASNDEIACAIYNREQKVLSEIPETIKNIPTDVLALKTFNLVGITALKSLFTENIDTFESKSENNLALNFPKLSTLIDKIALDEHGLVMLMGKGGVGKTTMAAAVAIGLAERGFQVHLSTSDPAAHLSETLNSQVKNLTISKIDPRVETENYRNKVLEERGKNLDEQGRAMLEEDLRSPCTEEIAVFQAFSKIVKEAGKKFVVMDTAPTGHTLLLLDATGAYHREMARQTGATNILTPMMQLQDPKQTKIILVTLAETTPVLEAEHLQEDLKRAGIAPWAWIINNSIAATNTKSQFLLKRANNELKEIEKVEKTLSSLYAIVPLQKNEPVGYQELLKLIS